MHKRIALVLILGVGGALLTRTYLFEAVSVVSGSMSPTLFVGQQYLVNKLVYRLHPPRRGDIIVFRDPVDPRVGMIKRVIAVAGDRIELKEKKVILNGSLLHEPYTVYLREKEQLEGDTMEPLQVPDGHVFVLGDNRDVSLDSSSWRDPQSGRHVYFVPVSNIRGRLIKVP